VVMTGPGDSSLLPSSIGLELQKRGKKRFLPRSFSFSTVSGEKTIGRGEKNSPGQWPHFIFRTRREKGKMAGGEKRSTMDECSLPLKSTEKKRRGKGREGVLPPVLRPKAREKDSGKKFLQLVGDVPLPTRLRWGGGTRERRGKGALFITI